VPRLSLLAIFLLLLFAPARAADSLDHARQARQLLGPETWARVIRIENEGRSRRYPRIVHALVFELAGILWFYTDTDGTQSFSLHRNNLEAEKADFAPLLRDIEPGFTRWTVESAGSASLSSERLPNGCFIESVAALRHELAAGSPVQRPRLLSFYQHDNTAGHTVLVFEAGGRTCVIDADPPFRTHRFPARLTGEPLELARLLGGSRVATARWVPIEDWAWRTRVAASAPAADRAGPGA
jgi:hypothetical protein